MRERKESEETFWFGIKPTRSKARFVEEVKSSVLDMWNKALMCKYPANVGSVGWRKFGATDVETLRGSLKPEWVISSSVIEALEHKLSATIILLFLHT